MHRGGEKERKREREIGGRRGKGGRKEEANRIKTHLYDTHNPTHPALIYRIALFSLGTMAVYRYLRQQLEECGVKSVMDELKGRKHGEEACKDKVSLKYVDRLKGKLTGGVVC